jgi:hypothetical protein
MEPSTGAQIDRGGLKEKGTEKRNNKHDTPVRTDDSETKMEPRKTQFPLARIKKIMKADRDVQNISQDAVGIVGLATVSTFLRGEEWFFSLGECYYVFAYNTDP